MKRFAIFSLFSLAMLCSPLAASAQTSVTDRQGVQYMLPSGWQARLQNRGIQMFPPQATPSEIYLAMRYEWGFRRADREKVLRVFDNITSKLGTHLQRKADRWLRSPRGDVVVLTYQGVNSGGIHQTARYYFASLGQTSIVVLAAGETELLKTRIKDVAKIFVAAVDRKAAPQNSSNVIDGNRPRTSAARQQLIGRWIRRVKKSDNGSEATVTYVFHFHANGRLTLQISTDSSNAGNGTSLVANHPQSKTYTGEWKVDNGTLVMTFSNGPKAQVTYEIFSYKGIPALKLTLPGKTPAYYLKIVPRQPSNNGAVL